MAFLAMSLAGPRHSLPPLSREVCLGQAQSARSLRIAANGDSGSPIPQESLRGTPSADKLLEPFFLDRLGSLLLISWQLEEAGLAILRQASGVRSRWEKKGLSEEAVRTLDRLHRRFATYSAFPGRPLRFLFNLLEDAPIWKRKRFVGKPTLCDGDGPIPELRVWMRQFFPELAAASE